MSKQNVIAIFDVGKTNKKLFLFDENYKVVFERCERLKQTVDEDGDSCEDVYLLKRFLINSLDEILSLKDFEIKAINFSAYGASLVYLNEKGEVVAPLYNYLKPYPESLQKQFYDRYGGEEEFSLKTASPVLGSLNSGMQLYRLKYIKPGIYNRIKYALHLPQYLSYLVSSKMCSDITSIGCHTNLWDFEQNDYHYWAEKEGVYEKLPLVLPSTHVNQVSFGGNEIPVGIGLHDSSAALIPYLVSFAEPFVLISTGTWCISLNPFNNLPLTKEELKNDCLCYLTYKGDPVKASRLFAGYDHDEQLKRMVAHFKQTEDRYHSMKFNPEIFVRLQKENVQKGLVQKNTGILKISEFAERNLAGFINDEEAYHQLIFDIISQQYLSTQLVIEETNVKRIFVDGGFSKNEIYMNLLAFAFPEMEVFSASMAQASAVGAAICIHNTWNKNPLPKDIVELKYFPSPSKPVK